MPRLLYKFAKLLVTRAAYTVVVVVTDEVDVAVVVVVMLAIEGLSPFSIILCK